MFNSRCYEGEICVEDIKHKVYVNEKGNVFFPDGSPESYLGYVVSSDGANVVFCEVDDDGCKIGKRFYPLTNRSETRDVYRYFTTEKKRILEYNLARVNESLEVLDDESAFRRKLADRWYLAGVFYKEGD